MIIRLLMFFFITLSSLSAGQLLQWESSKLSYKAKLADKGTTFRFKFKNVSGADVQIEKIKSSCACMRVKSEFPFKVAKGKDGIIEADYNFAGKAGFNRGNIEVIYAGKRITLNVEVDIPLPVVITPRFLIWKKGDRNSKKVEISLHPDWQGKILNVKPHLDGIDTKMSKDKNKYTIEVTPPAKSELAKKRTWLLVNGVDEEGKNSQYRVYLIIN